MNTGIMIFEEIHPSHRWIIRLYVSLRREVFFLRIGRLAANEAWVDSYINKGYIKEYKLDPKLYFWEGIYSDKAFDNIELFYGTMKNSKIIEMMKKLYGNGEADRIFKKELLGGLSRFYFLNSFLNDIRERCPEDNIGFIPSDGIELYRTDGCEIRDYSAFLGLAKKSGASVFDTARIRFPAWAMTLSYISVLKRWLGIRLKILGLLFRALFVRLSAFAGRKSLKRSYKYAVMITSPRRQFVNNIRKVDFLIDGSFIKKEDVIFLPSNKMIRKNGQYLAENGLDYLDNTDRFVSLKEIKEILPVYGRMLFSLNNDNIILQSGLKAVFFYLRWKSFSRNVRIDNLVTHAEFGQQSVARNIILEKCGCVTHFYMDSANFGCFFTDDKLLRRHLAYALGFLYYDYFISWNNEVSDYFRSSFCAFKNYLDLGCLWAEHVRLVGDGKLKSGFKEKLASCGYKNGMRLISVFDSGFHDDTITTYEDGINFLNGILRLLDDMPQVFVIFKQKHPRTVHRNISGRAGEILELYDKLMKHPRCHSLENTESTSEAIASSDVTVSCPFTSTTFEALSARRKAIWYDASNKFRNTFFDSIPGLVCHDYKEFFNRIEELLTIDKDKYDLYLDRYVKGKVENYLDGKAIERFRSHLANRGSGRERAASPEREKRYELV